MTHRPLRNRTRMMTGCGSAALTFALAMASGQAAAQGIQAEGNVVFGDASFFELASPTGGTTIIEANTPTVVIDWTPFEDAQGNALDFLPEGNEAIFQNGFDVLDFAVLNRILPSTNGSVAVINGTVIGRIQQGTARGTPLSPFVAFYSPTGFLIGSSAVFDVGQLLLTTLDATPTSFESFVNGGTLSLAGQAGSTARISIAPGAQILSPAENGFFAVVAADVQMQGTAFVNGSQAYVAGEVVNLRLSNGLFDIEVPVGTAAAGNVLRLDGTIGGPASTGGLDNHAIYGVAVAQNDPITMLLRGNIGFEPATQAGIVNGEIILSANYDVAGRFVNGSSSDQGINATFGAEAGNGGARADILIENVAATSGLTAVGSNLVRLSAIGGNATVGGNLLLAGRQAAEVLIGANAEVSVAGGLLVSADVYGTQSSQQAASADATGGDALIEAVSGGRLTVGGGVRVTADAFAGADGLALTTGSAQGGTARILLDAGANVVIGSSTEMSARALGGILFGAASEGTLQGGTVEIDARGGSDVNFGGDVVLNASAFTRTSGAAEAGSVSGGTVRLTNIGSTLDVPGNVFADASANGGGSNSVTGGALADAGDVRVVVDGTASTTIAGVLSLSANASGGYSFGGVGGDAFGGVALAITRNGGTLDVTGEFLANADAFAGFGIGGGAAFGGVAGAVAETGRIDLRATASASAFGIGGDGFVGDGENGGDGTGGTAVFRADGTLTQTAALAVGNGIIANADGFGGEGGRTNGLIRGGRGGDGRGGSAALPNQADPTFAGGAYILAGGDNGTLTSGALSNASARGFGGDGGDYTTFDPNQTAEDAGDGGNGIGGTAQVGTALLGGGDGSLGAGLARFAGMVVDVEGNGGEGGRDEGDGFFLGTGTGIAGTGTGGSALLTVGGGEVITSSIDLRAPGIGGLSQNGGLGQGGRAAILGGAQGTLTAGSTAVDAVGQGGFGDGGSGGAAIGGEAAIELDGITATFGSIVSVNAIGFGGFGSGGNGGTGTGGEAFIGLRTDTLGSGTFEQIATIEAHGLGGGAAENFVGGAGIGGSASVVARGGSTLRFRAMFAAASGDGGENEGLSPPTQGGDGFGGSVEVSSTGSGSRIIVETNDIGEFSDRLSGGAMLAALGLGGQTTGGSGIGGAGTGGSILLRAAQGGSITLPQTPLTDPGSPGAIGLAANGIGGDSVVAGGTAGAGLGGSGRIEADGGTISMGATDFSVYGQGGSGGEPSAATGGGRGDGGTRLIRVTGGGSLTGEFSAGRAGGFGGLGTGGRSGGDASTGISTIEVNGASTFNIVGTLLWVDTSTGGSGEVGGSVSAKGGDVAEVALRADNATITFTPDSKGETALIAGVRLTGGNGVTNGGGVTDGLSVIDLRQTTVTGGNIQLENTATGGNASGSGGIGGNAAASRTDLIVTGSTLGLVGSNVVSSTATGGVAIGGNGGSAVNAIGPEGTVNASFVNSAVTIAAAGQNPGSLLISSRAFAGAGNITGNAFARAARLSIDGGSLQLDRLQVQSLGSAGASFSGQTGGAATSDIAELRLDGTAQLTADAITISADAQSSLGGTAAAGEALVTLPAGSQARAVAQNLTLSANALGGGPNVGSSVAGRYAVNAAGGTVDVTFLNASASGDGLPAGALASQITATGGAVVRTAALLNLSALGDITLQTGQGGTIGNPDTNANETTIAIFADGTIRMIGDGSAGSGLFGQSANLIAGRSILIDGSIVTRDGTIELTANTGSGVPLAQPSPSVIAMGAGGVIDAGTGTVAIRLFDGGTDPQRATGAITLARVSGGFIDARNFGTSAGSDVGVLASGVLTASGNGRAIDLASLNGEVINLAGDAGLVLTGGGHYGIFAATPTGSQIGSFANYVRRYNVPSAEAYDQLNPGGNFAAFRLAPILTVSADNATRFYGNANPAFTASITGFQPGDGVGDLTGAALLTTLADGTSAVGQYAIDVALGTLLSEQGYQFAIGNGGILDVTPRPITITADSLSKIYGNANPALTFAVGGLGLVNGDQLTGALATTADATTGVGNVAITQGSLAASSNYAVTFVDGILSITPRAITITADNLSRIYGNANPALTFAVGGLGLVNGDQLTGALTTTAGATTGVGNVAITQGTLAASPNYSVTFNAGILTITPRALTITANNLSRIYGDANPALTFTLGGLGLVNGDQLTGALATTAGTTTGVGDAAITQGTLAAGANYAVTFNTGILRITPRPITITADNLSKLLGLRDPALSFVVSGAGLVNGDQLSGALTRDPGELAGAYAIRQGTLSASANYAVTYVGGELTINPAPTPPGLDNPTSFEDPIDLDDPPPTPDEEEDAFGMDFPEQPDAALITGDTLLDDPVASGNDALVTSTPGDDDDDGEEQ